MGRRFRTWHVIGAAAVFLLACMCAPVWAHTTGGRGHLYGYYPTPEGLQFGIIGPLDTTRTEYVWFWDSNLWDAFEDRDWRWTRLRYAGVGRLSVAVVQSILAGCVVSWGISRVCAPRSPPRTSARG